MKWPKSWVKVEMGGRLSTVRQNFCPIPNRTSGSASGTMPLPTGIMPHSADFTAPTDGNLHLPTIFKAGFTPPSRPRKKTSSSIQFFQFALLLISAICSELLITPASTSWTQSLWQVETQRAAALYVYCGAVCLCLCLCMLDQSLKKYLLSVYIIPCGAQEFFFVDHRDRCIFGFPNA